MAITIPIACPCLKMSIIKHVVKAKEIFWIFTIRGGHTMKQKAGIWLKDFGLDALFILGGTFIGILFKRFL